MFYSSSLNTLDFYVRVNEEEKSFKTLKLFPSSGKQARAGKP
jgi:hypothetical protein